MTGKGPHHLHICLLATKGQKRISTPHFSRRQAEVKNYPVEPRVHADPHSRLAHPPCPFRPCSGGTGIKVQGSAPTSARTTLPLGSPAAVAPSLPASRSVSLPTPPPSLGKAPSPLGRSLNGSLPRKPPEPPASSRKHENHLASPVEGPLASVPLAPTSPAFFRACWSSWIKFCSSSPSRYPLPAETGAPRGGRLAARPFPSTGVVLPLPEPAGTRRGQGRAPLTRGGGSGMLSTAAGTWRSRVPHPCAPPPASYPYGSRRERRVRVWG